MLAGVEAGAVVGDLAARVTAPSAGRGPRRCGPRPRAAARCAWPPARSGTRRPAARSVSCRHAAAAGEAHGRLVHAVEQLDLLAQRRVQPVAGEVGRPVPDDDRPQLAALASAASLRTVASSAAARAGSRSSSADAASAVSRRLNSFCDTASCSSRAIRSRSSTMDSSRLCSYSRALTRAIAACAASSRTSSSSSAVNPPGLQLLARNSSPRISSPSMIGMPRKSVSSGCAFGHQPKCGWSRMLASRTGFGSHSISAEHAVLARQRADRRPLLVGQRRRRGTRRSRRPRPGTPSAAYRAPTSLRAEVRIVLSTSRTDRCAVTASTAALTSRSSSRTSTPPTVPTSRVRIGRGPRTKGRGRGRPAPDGTAGDALLASRT